VSEFAKAVLKLPVSPQREREDRERKRLFQKQKAELKDAIIRDRRLTLQTRYIGYEIADALNFKTGYAWPSQKFLAEKTGFSERTIWAATKKLADSQTGIWFRRELDEKNYCYYPRFERLKEPPAPVDNTRKSQQVTPANAGVAICDLSSLRESPLRENLSDGFRKPIVLPPTHRAPDGSNDDRSRKVIELGDLDATITAIAHGEGKRRFVFYDSTPWQLWNEHLASQGLPPLRPRQHMMDGLLRIGCDVPTIYPPGHRRCKPRWSKP